MDSEHCWGSGLGQDELMVIMSDVIAPFSFGSLYKFTATKRVLHGALLVDIIKCIL